MDSIRWGPEGLLEMRDGCIPGNLPRFCEGSNEGSKKLNLQDSLDLASRNLQ